MDDGGPQNGVTTDIMSSRLGNARHFTQKIKQALSGQTKEQMVAKTKKKAREDEVTDLEC